MTALVEKFNAFVEAAADAIAEAAATKFEDKLRERISRIEDDPLLSTCEIAKELGIAPVKVRALVNANILKKARGFTDIRVRQSVVRAYGKDDK